MNTESTAPALTSNQQLSFDVLNFANSPSGTQNVIYITTDPTFNKVTLQILLSSGSVTLQPGTITDPTTPPTDGSVLYLDLSSLSLSSSVWTDLSLSANGWKFEKFDNSVVGMSPTQATTLSAGSAGVNLEISGLEIPQALPTPNVTLYVTYYGIEGISGMFSSFQVAILNSPFNKDQLSDVIAVTVDRPDIINSRNSQTNVANSFVLQFSPGPQHTPVNAVQGTIFTVSFVYGPPNDSYGYGALTDVTDALNIHAAHDVNADKWLITENSQQQSPSWSLQPPKDLPIVGTGAGAVVGIKFSNIVTPYQPGPTVMLVSYTNVPGYSDGAFSIVLEKVAHVYINSLDATPNPAVLSNGEATVQLSWVADAPSLTLMPGEIDVSGRTSHTAQISDTTLFTLIAEGLDVPNRATADVTVDILPLINAINAEPQNIYYKDFPHDILLDWDVDTTGTVVLTNTANTNQETFPASYTDGETVAGPQMFTLAPSEQVPSLFIERNEVISAFQLASQNVSFQGNPQAIAVAPMANLYAVVVGGSDPVLIMESITNTSYGPSVTAGKEPACLMFSHHGDYLFVGNKGDSTLSVIGVTFDASSSSYSFAKIKDVSLSGAPTDLDVASDDSYIFVATNGTHGNLDVIKNDGGGNFFVVNSIQIGSSVDGVAALPSFAQVFVVSAADASVSVVGYSSISSSFQLVGTIKGFQSNDGPCDVAIVGQDSSTLLIACKGSNSVYAVNKDVPSVSGRQKLSVGQAPVRLATIEEGSYAYVSNSADNTVSLISCFKGSGFCSVLENALPAGTSPGALTASSDGSLLYVPNTNGSSVTVFNAQTYTNSGVQASVTIPTSIAASEEWVASWYNYDLSIKAPGLQPTPGLSIYDRTSQTIDSVNPSTEYVDLKFWPDPSLNRAFAIVHGDNNLYLLETAKFTTVKKVSLSSSSTCVPVGLSIAAWGNMVFVLTVDTGGVYQLVVVECDMSSDSCSVVATVPLFTETASSTILITSVSDGSQAFVTDSVQKKMYVVSKNASGVYQLDPTTYTFILLPHGLVCAPDDSQLYVWMNEGADSAFALYDIQAGTLENFSLPANISLQVTGLTISPDGSRLFVTDTNFGGIRVFSTGAMQNIENISLPGASFPMGLAVAPDASQLYTANAFSGNFSIAQQLVPVPRGISLDEFSTGQDYQGIFMRDYIGQTPTSNTGSGWTLSPDIIPWGPTVYTPTSDFGNAANYNTDYGTGRTMTEGMINNVYVRGLNTAAGLQKSRVYFFWVQAATVLVPTQWSFFGFQYQGNPQNWLDITAQAINDIAYSEGPLFWIPSTQYPHYCLVVWVDNSSNPVEPDLTQYAFATCDELGQFIMSHPNVAWRNTNDVTDPVQFLNTATLANGPSQGGDVTVGVIMKRVPNLPIPPGTIQFNLSNSDGSISYNSPVHTIDTNTFSQTISWPANVPDPMLVYTYVPASGSLQGGEQIIAFTSYLPPSAVLKRAFLRHKDMLLKVRRDGFGSLREFVLGTVEYKYTGS